MSLPPAQIDKTLRAVIRLDGPRLVDVIVFPSNAKLQPFASPARARHAGLVDGLLGRRLLKQGAVLHVDYVTKIGAITSPLPV